MLGPRLFVLSLLTACLPAFALTRMPNTTLNLPAAPPPAAYATELAFGALTFTNPVAVATPPGETNRLFVVEQRGYVAVITNLATPNRSIFLNISGQVAGGVPNDERGLLGMAFHPGYATNGHFFVYYSRSGVLSTNPNGTINNGLHQMVSRFTVSPGNPHAANAASEVVLLAMFDRLNNHNAGCLHFGPDGYLYVSTGDEGGANDPNNNAQTITSNLWAGILRIDVDSRPENLLPKPHHSHRFAGWNGVINFRVPEDNPFVGATAYNGVPVDTNLVRTEFWATGLRNPWRFSFDPLTGLLYCADVGQSAWEEVNVIQAGGNYGWAYREGFTNGPKAALAPTGFVGDPPILVYGRGTATNQGFSVTGGVVYRGSRFPSLAGKYIFADYVSGHIWAAEPNGTNAAPFYWLTTDATIAGFGYDPRNGDVLLCDQDQDTIKRLVTQASASTAPLLLSGTGAFADLATLAPQPGIVPYELNLPFWSDNADKTRWFSVPNTNLALGFAPEGNWLTPTGAVWVKHFELVTNTLTGERRRLETRFLVRYTNGIYGLTYRWTTPPTNAVLVPEEGLFEPLAVNDAGLLRTQVWHYPGRGECLTCHTPASGGVLGFNTLQINRDVDFGGGATNQLIRLASAGYFTNPPPTVNALRAFAHFSNETASLEWRVRSYLDVNCASCHQAGGIAASWDARAVTPTRFANLINGTPANPGANPAARLVLPGDTNLSVIHQRVNTRGAGAMPPIASALVDTNGVQLLARWIAGDLTNYQSYAAWQVAKFGATNAPNSGELDDFDGDRARNYLEYLTGTDPLVPGDGWSLGFARTGATAVVNWTQPANRAVVIEQNTNPAISAAWTPLDAEWNRPCYPASNGVQQFIAPQQPPFTPLFFRGRISEP